MDVSIKLILVLILVVIIVVALLLGIGTSDSGSGSGPTPAPPEPEPDEADWVAVGQDNVGDAQYIIPVLMELSWQDIATGTSKFGSGSGSGFGIGIAYGTSSDGSCLWVAVGDGTHHILYSKDGISWQATATGTSKFGGPDEQGFGIAYGTSSDGSCLWVAVGRWQRTIYYTAKTEFLGKLLQPELV